MAETITCHLINGHSFPLNEQMSNESLSVCLPTDRQIHVLVLWHRMVWGCEHMYDVCRVRVCVWLSGNCNKEKLFIRFEYGTHFNDDDADDDDEDANRPNIISAVISTNVKLHDYTLHTHTTHKHTHMHFIDLLNTWIAELGSIQLRDECVLWCEFWNCHSTGTYYYYLLLCDATIYSMILTHTHTHRLLRRNSHRSTDGLAACVQCGYAALTHMLSTSSVVGCRHSCVATRITPQIDDGTGKCN